MLYYVVWWMATDVLEEPAPSICNFYLEDGGRRLL
jgi:hypothetical protein